MKPASVGRMLDVNTIQITQALQSIATSLAAIEKHLAVLAQKS